jgi:glycerol-3-phosphate dehydrogenase
MFIQGCNLKDPVRREDLLSRLRENKTWDVIIIGGGATGLGAAVDAASRGYQTVLLESHDYAKGTSSKATKLVHGGVRYLAQGNIGLVRDALRERGLMRQNAPHLVSTMGFVIPAYRLIDLPFYGMGLKVYDVLAGSLNLKSSRLLSKSEALSAIPTLIPEGLKGGIIYHDGQFDDARLAISLARTFADLGGLPLNYMPVIGLQKTGDKVSGVITRDAESGEEFRLSGQAVINATGVQVDSVRQMDEPQTPSMLSPSQGVHLVVDKAFIPLKDSLMIPRTDDGRVLFGVPWHDKVILGTTDTAVNTISLEPRPLEQEVEFILRTANRYLVKKPSSSDIRSMFAGLRPLVKKDASSSTKALSRDHVIRISSSGLITITGGKWTTYRKMGEDVIDQAQAVASLLESPSKTAHLKLRGYTEEKLSEPWWVYGSDAKDIQALTNQTKLSDALPYNEAQVRYAIREEFARTIEDVLARRTRALLLDAKASLEVAPRVAAILAEELKYSSEKLNVQLANYRTLAKNYMV